MRQRVDEVAARARRTRRRVDASNAESEGLSLDCWRGRWRRGRERQARRQAWWQGGRRRWRRCQRRGGGNGRRRWRDANPAIVAVLSRPAAAILAAHAAVVAHAIRDPPLLDAGILAHQRRKGRGRRARWWRAGRRRREGWRRRRRRSGWERRRRPRCSSHVAIDANRVDAIAHQDVVRVVVGRNVFQVSDALLARLQTHGLASPKLGAIALRLPASLAEPALVRVAPRRWWRRRWREAGRLRR